MSSRIDDLINKTLVACRSMGLGVSVILSKAEPDQNKPKKPVRFEPIVLQYQLSWIEDVILPQSEYHAMNISPQVTFDPSDTQRMFKTSTIGGEVSISPEILDTEINHLANMISKHIYNEWQSAIEKRRITQLYSELSPAAKELVVQIVKEGHLVLDRAYHAREITEAVYWGFVEEIARYSDSILPHSARIFSEIVVLENSIIAKRYLFHEEKKSKPKLESKPGVVTHGI